MKVAILTNFQEFLPGYSLTGIVKDQIEMLSRHGNEVHLFVNSKYHGEDFPGNVTLHKSIPFAHLKDYASLNQISPEHHKIIQETDMALTEELKDFDVAFTHDFVFTGWNIIYGEGSKRASRKLPKLKWMHWIHSIPTGGRDYWDIKAYGPNHKLIYPNSTDRIKVAEEYKGWSEDVRVIPHIKDLRSFFDFCEDSRFIIDKCPNVMQAEMVQILPASVDRLEAKRVREVMAIFGGLKRIGHSVFLLIANQWATGKQQKDSVESFRTTGAMEGLISGEDFAFTSDLKKEMEIGVSKQVIREMFLCSNLFIFPTREESFGLVVPEAALAGNFMVLNKSLHMQIEVSGGAENALFFDFGSFTHNFNVDDPGRYYTDIAKIISGRMKENESIRGRTFARRKYNMDNLYRRYYLPVMSEAVGTTL